MNTVAEDFGKRLTHAREARGLSVEEAARATRMRPAHIQALESSNLSRFPNAAYAKSFLLMYGRFLNVDINDVASAIDTTTQMSVQDFQYLSSRAEDDKEAQKAAADTRYDFVVPHRESRSWLPMVVVLFILVVAGVAFMVSMNLTRIEDAPTAAADAPKAETPAQPATAATQPATGVTQPATAAAQPGATSPASGPAPVVATPAATPTVAPAPAPIAQAPASNAPPLIGTTQTPTATPLTPAQATAAATAPRPSVVATPAGGAPVAVPVERDPVVPKARPISPVASIAADDSAMLAAIPVPAKPVNPPVPTRSELSVSRDDADVVLLQPRRKTWVIIRNGPGGQPIFEDYLYPTARPMRLPPGKYFIELKEADAVSIVRNGKPITYVAPGVMVQ